MGLFQVHSFSPQNMKAGVYFKSKKQLDNVQHKIERYEQSSADINMKDYNKLQKEERYLKPLVEKNEYLAKIEENNLKNANHLSHLQQKNQPANLQFNNVPPEDCGKNLYLMA